MRISSHAPNRKRQITVRFIDYSRILGHQYGTCFLSPFWRLENLGDPWTRTLKFKSAVGFPASPFRPRISLPLRITVCALMELTLRDRHRN
jgi:hypothetical protein